MPRKPTELDPRRPVGSSAAAAAERRERVGYGLGRTCRICASFPGLSSIVFAGRTSIPTPLALLADACRLNALVAVKRAGSGISVHVQRDGNRRAPAVRGVEHRRARQGDPDRDVFFSSKGHDVPGLYALLFALGIISRERLLRLRRFGGLDGHPDVGVPGIKASLGSLGMGIAKGRGIALANGNSGAPGVRRHARRRRNAGRSDLGGAAVSRAPAPRRALIVVDHNEVQSDKLTWRSSRSATSRRSSARSAGTSRGRRPRPCRAARGLRPLREGDAPKALVARTIKGKGVSFMEHPVALAEGGGRTAGTQARRATKRSRRGVRRDPRHASGSS